VCKNLKKSSGAKGLMTWGIPNKRDKLRNILILVQTVQGEEFPDLEASVYQEILYPFAAVIPAEGLNSS
jgi:hypothetical protein